MSSTLLRQFRFKFEWRDYQQHFLDHFQEHITDNHLHVVAPPGSGKTILGLEMLIRIHKPTLVLAPTLTIRNQWKSRFQTFFEGARTFKNISLTIKEPSHLTFSTYQSLFSLYKSFGEKANEALLDFIVENKIQTIVLDEAHHLKNGWWKALFALKEVPGLTIIALTATPPYDSSALEIERYFRLCGPIDDEIAVPSLIKNGDLCPHQDYVYFSRPNKAEIKYIINYREQIMAFTNGLLNDLEFIAFLKKLPIYFNSEEALEVIYKNPSFFSSVLIYLKATGEEIDKSKLELLGFKKDEPNFPSFSYEWSEVLLQEILIDNRESYIAYEYLLKPIEKELRSIGVLEKRRVNFIGDAALYRNLASSPSKFKSIMAIIDATYQNLQSDTKAVILTDFIRKEYLSFTGDHVDILNKIGVVSIFQYLLCKTDLGCHVAVLTGTLVILPKVVLKSFKAILELEAISLTEIQSSREHYSISVPSSIKNKVVAAVTELFESGKLKILIGTKSLLGEGWDAPSINTLILASYVGSFVSSNQMRGRAIRIDPKTPTKIGAIWHLVCLDPTISDGGRDFEVLQQRFQAFTGVSLKGEPYIENGLARLQLPENWDATLNISTVNDEMLKMASDGANVEQRWKVAIEKGNILVQELRMPYKQDTSFAQGNRLNAVNVAKYLFVQLLAGIGLFLPEAILKNWTVLLQKGWLATFYIVLMGILFGFGPATFKALKVYFLYGNQFKRTQKIANSLYQYLLNSNSFTAPESILNVGSYQRENGTYSIYLKGANQHDGNLFVGLLEETIAPIENPRYLLEVSGFIKQFFGYRNYYAVPLQLGKNKKEAAAFHNYWQRFVGGSKLVYARTTEGRKILLRARFAHIKYIFEEKPKKTNAWK